MIIETLEKFESYVSMRLYFLFPTVKAAGLYPVFNKSYSENTPSSSVLK
jgi:hypothetical protein